MERDSMEEVDTPPSIGIFSQTVAEKVHIVGRWKQTGQKLTDEEVLMIRALLDDPRFVFYEDRRINLVSNMVRSN